MREVLVLGKGGFGAELAELLCAAGVCDAPLFLDDQAPGCAGKLRDFLSPALRQRCSAAYVGLGNNALRLELLRKLAEAGYATPVFIHPSAVVCPSAALGTGTVVLPFAFVGANVKTGPGCILNAGCLVDHDTALGAAVHAAPGSIIKAGATVPDLTKVESGTVVASPW